MHRKDLYIPGVVQVPNQRLREAFSRGMGSSLAGAEAPSEVKRLESRKSERSEWDKKGEEKGNSPVKRGSKMNYNEY